MSLAWAHWPSMLGLTVRRADGAPVRILLRRIPRIDPAGRRRVLRRRRPLRRDAHRGRRHDRSRASIDAITAPRNRLVIRASSLTGRRRYGMELVVERVALVFEQLKVRFPVTVENHAHAPRPREHLRILDRHLIRDVIGVERREAFDQVQLDRCESFPTGRTTSRR